MVFSQLTAIRMHIKLTLILAILISLSVSQLLSHIDMFSDLFFYEKLLAYTDEDWYLLQYPPLYRFIFISQYFLAYPLLLIFFQERKVCGYSSFIVLLVGLLIVVWDFPTTYGRFLRLAMTVVFIYLMVNGALLKQKNMWIIIFSALFSLMSIAHINKYIIKMVEVRIICVFYIRLILFYLIIIIRIIGCKNIQDK